jgi:hypothetical protein
LRQLATLNAVLEARDRTMSSPEAKKIKVDGEEAGEDEGDQIMPALAEADAVQAQLAVVRCRIPGPAPHSSCSAKHVQGPCHPPCGSRPARAQRTSAV